MEVYGYGEDALTLWAIKEKFDLILSKLDDSSDKDKCKVLFRPSFGRRGGENSSQFGEFDFIILTKDTVYLGESKWNRSSELKERELKLKGIQKLRHYLMEIYIEEWKNSNKTWDNYIKKVETRLETEEIEKPVPPRGSLLQRNLETTLGIIDEHFDNQYSIKNLLLYLYPDRGKEVLQLEVDKEFILVKLDYLSDTRDNFIRLDL